MPATNVGLKLYVVICCLQNEEENHWNYLKKSKENVMMNKTIIRSIKKFEESHDEITWKNLKNVMMKIHQEIWRMSWWNYIKKFKAENHDEIASRKIFSIKRFKIFHLRCSSMAVWSGKCSTVILILVLVLEYLVRPQLSPHLLLYDMADH